MKNKRSFSEKLPLILAFVLPILIMLGVFAGKEIFPFGKNCFLRTDLYHQYIAFFEDLGDRLRQGKSLLYAFDIGLGSNYTALFAYYLSSPLHFLAVLVPTEYMIEFITILVVLKIGLCGWTMAWYLSKRFNTRHMGIAFCGICYALSGYLAAYNWNIMWLDVLWLSIIAIYGLEKLVKENRPFLYCVAMALSILCNYYIAIMLCIFMVLYFINQLIVTPRLGIKGLLIRSGNFFLFSLIAGMIAAILVIPCAYALMGTASADTSFPRTVSNYFAIIDMLARHLVVVNVEIGLDHWPNIYSGVMVFLLIPLYYMNKKINFREKIANTMLLGFMLLSFNTNMLNYIWHGFHYPNSLPCRQSFLYTFMVMVMCFEGIRHLELISKQLLTRVLWGAVAAILVAEVITNSDEIPYYACYASIAFIGLYSLFIYLRKAGKIQRGTAVALCLCLLILEMGLNTAVTSVTIVNREEFMRYNDSIDELTAIAQEGKIFTRIERQSLRTKNDGVYFGYNSASIFSSTANAAITDFYKKTGMEGNTNAYSITGATPFMNAFLGIEYKLSDYRLPISPLYELVETAPERRGGVTFLYHNLYTLPLGYLIPDDVHEAWRPTTSSPVRSQNSYANLAANTDNIFETVAANINGAVMTATVPKAGHYYVYVASSSVKKVEASVNGQNTKTWDSINRNYLVDYGYVEEGDELKLVAQDVTSMTANLYYLNPDVFIEAVTRLSENPFVIDEFTDESFKTQIKGHVDALQDSHLVFSIPLEKGWSISVDGKPAEITALADAFVGVLVPAGHHEVVLRYVPEGLATGILVSLLGLGVFLILLALYLLFFRKKHPENESRPEEDNAVNKNDPVDAARAGRERMALMHQFDEEERLRDQGRLPVISFTEEGNAVARFVSPAERQKDAELLSLEDSPENTAAETPEAAAETLEAAAKKPETEPETAEAAEAATEKPEADPEVPEESSETPQA